VISVAYFDDLYRTQAQAFERRFQDARKRALTLASLPRERYELAFEPGCGEGHLTRELSSRCNRVIAADFSQTALRRARKNLGGLSVDIRQLVLPAQWPTERFDLIVVSELLYCLRPDELEQFNEQVLRSLRPGGNLLLAHSRAPVPEYPIDAERAHEGLLEMDGLRPLAGYADQDVLIDVWEATTPAN
jgi:SAM-dependent methyltransferase